MSKCKYCKKEIKWVILENRWFPAAVIDNRIDLGQRHVCKVNKSLFMTHKPYRSPKTSLKKHPFRFNFSSDNKDQIDLINANNLATLPV